jgi:hypothetical protein
MINKLSSICQSDHKVDNNDGDGGVILFQDVIALLQASVGVLVFNVDKILDRSLA